MTPGEIDRILSRREEIVPSSGFVASVMDAVRHEAEAPPPFDIQWDRARPLFWAATVIFLVLTFVGASALFQGGTGNEIASSGALSALDWLFDPAKSFGAGWIALALILSAASVKFSAWLTSRT